MGIAVGRWRRWGAALLLLIALSASAHAQGTADSTAVPKEVEALSGQVAQLRERGQFAEAIPFARQLVDLLEQTLGPGHPRLAAALNDLAVLYLRQGDFRSAEPLFTRTLNIREKALGTNHPDVARTLGNLAGLYVGQGLYTRAEPLLRRALAIRESALGADHPDVARTLSNLASLLSDQGRYTEAEPLLRRALAIQKRVNEPENPIVATVLNNLAELYRTLGRFGEAEPLFREALAIQQKVLGAEHPEVAINLNGLADLYRDAHRYDEAEPLYRRALAIAERALGPEHPRTAQSLDDLGALTLELGRDREAEPLLTRALAIRERALGAQHPDVGESLFNLARWHDAQGHRAEAEPLYRRSLAIREQSLGPQHPLTSQTLDGLAALLVRGRRVREALPLLERSLEIQERNLRTVLGGGSERQKRDYLATLAGTTDLALWVHRQGAPTDPRAARLALTTVLRRKGRLLDAASNSLAALRQRLSPADAPLLDDLTARRSALAALVFRGPGDDPPERYRSRIAALEKEADELEARLAARSTEYAREATPVTLEAVRARLPRGAALLELALFRSYGDRPAKTGATRFVAYLLEPTGKLSSFDLGEATALEADLAPLLRGLRDGDGALATLKPLARRLEARLTAPSRRTLASTTRQLFVSPDGPLNLLPFAALVDERGHFLLETYSISYLTSGRDLLRLGRPAPPATPALIVAAPFFDGTFTGANAVSRGRGQETANVAQLRFDPLPATAEEARAIARLLPGAQVLTGRTATEGAIRKVANPDVLHIATHGFFLDTSEDPAVDNPLLRSGLALAGFNRRSGGNEDDGALTALELASLDLRATRLVVLSACETGLGEVARGEGVYGLRRALTLAGSAAQVVSLWQVADEATRDLMVQYYRELRRGAGRAEGLRRAQLALLKRRAYRHPYYWSAFIPSGDWRPLNTSS